MGFLVSADDRQTGVFAGSTRVGLEAGLVETGDFAEVFFQAVNQFVVSLRLFGRNERMDACHFRQAQAHHFCRRVQLHRAGTQRNHGTVQSQVLYFQLLDITHHLGFAVVGIENRMSQVRSDSAQVFGNVFQDFMLAVAVAAFAAFAYMLLTHCFGQDANDFAHIVQRSGFVQADAESAVVEIIEVHAVRQGDFANLFDRNRAMEVYGVEEYRVELSEAVFHSPFS